MIIPCEECLVRAICTNKYLYSLTCPILFKTIVNNEGNSKIGDKVKRIEKLFNMSFDRRQMLQGSRNRISFSVYPDNLPKSVVMYHLLMNGGSQLDIIHKTEPNIPGLKKVGNNRWNIRFGWEMINDISTGESIK